MTPKPPEPTEPAQADVLVRGRAAWDNGKCMLCHGADGTGGQLGPSLTEGPWQHTDGTVASIVALLRTGIAKDKFENPAYPMPMEPATKLVSESELEALAEYVRSLRG